VSLGREHCACDRRKSHRAGKTRKSCIGKGRYRFAKIAKKTAGNCDVRPRSEERNMLIPDDQEPTTDEGLCYFASIGSTITNLPI
jgi:hypothetical protein